MNKYKNPWMLMLMIITGMIIGSLIGVSLEKFFPVLSYGPGSLGLRDFEFNLGVVYLSLSFLIDMNVSSLIGLLFAVLIFNRL